MVKYEELDMEVMEFEVDDVVGASGCELPNECIVIGNVPSETELIHHNA